MYKEDVLEKAENGIPHYMLELAKLYKAGAFGDTDTDQYLYWLREFFQTSEVKKAANDGNGATALLNDIVEAGISVGIYYSNSSDDHDLKAAAAALTAALNAGKQVGDKEVVNMISDMLTKINKRRGWLCQ